MVVNHLKRLSLNKSYCMILILMLNPSVLPFKIKQYTDQANGDDSQHNSHDNDGCRCSGSRLICKSILVVDVKLFLT